MYLSGYLLLKIALNIFFINYIFFYIDNIDY